MSRPELLLSNQLCFLVHRLDLAIGSKYRPILAKLGLTYGQYLAMLALWERRELGVGELCEMLDLDTGTVSPLLKRLEAAGLVERRRRDEDERAVAVRLTAAGAALEKKARAVPAAVSKCLAADREDYEGLAAVIKRMLYRLEGAPEEPAKIGP
jgi:MarR family transcriptional regulator, organic hydroperoxide resistance regulator